MYVTVAEVKKHLNIDSSFTDDDSYIQHLILAVENVVQTHIDRELSEFVNDGELLAPLKHAVLLLTGTYYANRETVTFVSSQALPHSYEYLIALYKNYAGSPEGTSNITENA